MGNTNVNQMNISLNSLQLMTSHLTTIWSDNGPTWGLLMTWIQRLGLSALRVLSNQTTYTAVCNVLWSHDCILPKTGIDRCSKTISLLNDCCCKKIIKSSQSFDEPTLWPSRITTVMGSLHYSCNMRTTCKTPAPFFFYFLGTKSVHIHLTSF